MSTASTTPDRRRRHWWQVRPMIGLLVGWITIALIGWRIWSALNGHHA